MARHMAESIPSLAQTWTEQFFRHSRELCPSLSYDEVLRVLPMVAREIVKRAAGPGALGWNYETGYAHQLQRAPALLGLTRDRLSGLLRRFREYDDPRAPSVPPHKMEILCKFLKMSGLWQPTKTSAPTAITNFRAPITTPFPRTSKDLQPHPG